MANVAVIGAQWGDEGKGKIVDWLSARADVVVRFQGGHNAGHTLVIDGVTYKLSLLPSGVVRPGKLAIIGNGVVVDPWALVEEIERLKTQGVSISPQNLMLAETSSLILPLHRELDRSRETSNSGTRIGTTGRSSTSITAPIPTSPRPTRWRDRRQRARAAGRAMLASCSASPRPTPRASAKAHSRRSSTTRSASVSVRPAPSSAR